MRKRKKILLITLLALAGSQLLLWGGLAYYNYGGAKKASFGVTFSPGQAYYFNLNPWDVLHASLTDLRIKKYRISAYWNKVEKKQNQFNFSEIDWQVNEIEKNNGEIVMAIGRRLPRWPECHDPDWLKGFNKGQEQQLTLKLIQKTIEHYDNRAVIKAWQVENEPLLSIFGDCPAPDIDFLKKEITFVRSLSKKPVYLTASGELSSWANEASLADKVGVSMYRVTWNSYIGLFTYPLNSAYYKYRARTVAALGKKVFVSELQAEPWERTSLPKTPIVEQLELMNPEKFNDSIKFAKDAGFDDIYLWGVEWWYWLKTSGNNIMWDAVKAQITNNK